MSINTGNEHKHRNRSIRAYEELRPENPQLEPQHAENAEEDWKEQPEPQHEENAEEDCKEQLEPQHAENAERIQKEPEQTKQTEKRRIK